MYRIVVCDDDKYFAKVLGSKIKRELSSHGEECVVEYYVDGKEVLSRIDTKPIDVLFLDIDMPEVTGIELAETIQRENLGTNIIFVTNREDLVFKAIHYQPFRFIRKDKVDEELAEAVASLVQKMHSEDRLIELKTKEGTVLLPAKKIIYMESCKHYLFVYCEDHSYEVRDKISNYETELSEYGFLKIHRSYLVNVRFIRSIKSTGVELDNDELLPISRDKLQEIKKLYLVYMRKFVYGNH